MVRRTEKPVVYDSQPVSSLRPVRVKVRLLSGQLRREFGSGKGEHNGLTRAPSHCRLGVQCKEEGRKVMLRTRALALRCGVRVASSGRSRANFGPIATLPFVHRRLLAEHFNLIERVYASAQRA